MYKFKIVKTILITVILNLNCSYAFLYSSLKKIDKN